MKKLPLSIPQYQYLEKGFKEWLDILGYSATGVYNNPHLVREFLYYLECKNMVSIEGLQPKHIKGYHDHISRRSNQRRGGGLSVNYLNKHLQAIEKFLAYLHHKGIGQVPAMGIRLQKLHREPVAVLSGEEIKSLFAATEKDALVRSHHYYNRFNEAMQARDKALLVVYYSCGLRRNEGVHLNIDDINLDTCILHVKKGKNYKERFVPFNKTNAAYLQDYIYDQRPSLAKDKKEGRLFISMDGRRTSGGTLNLRLQRLQKQSEDIGLQQKAVGLHTLRHSIATHLLAAGMSLEKIARFLGHSSLESTQIYTHLINKHEQL